MSPWLPLALRLFVLALRRYLSINSVSDPDKGGCIGVKVGPFLTVRSPLGARDRYRVYWMGWDGGLNLVTTWKEAK